MEDFILEQMLEDDQSILTDSDGSIHDYFDPFNNYGLDDDENDDILETPFEAEHNDYDEDDEICSMLEIDVDLHEHQYFVPEVLIDSTQSSSIKVSIESQGSNRDVVSGAQPMFFHKRSAEEVIEQVEGVFENIVDALDKGSQLSIMIRAKPSSVTTKTFGVRNTALRCVSFPGKTRQEAWKFSIANDVRIEDLDLTTSQLSSFGYWSSFMRR